MSAFGEHLGMVVGILIQVGGGFLVIAVLAVIGLLSLRPRESGAPAAAILAPLLALTLPVLWAAWCFGGAAGRGAGGTPWQVMVFWLLLLLPIAVAGGATIRYRTRSSWWMILAVGLVAEGLCLMVWFVGTMALYNDWP